MLASYPASILNHIPPPSGIPFDSFKTGNALGCGDKSYLSQSMMLASFTKPRKLAASLS